MNEKLTDEQSAEILKALNKAIEEGPWDRSNILRMIGKNITQARDDFLWLLGASTPAQMMEETRLANQKVTRSNQQEIYISLYAFDGANLQSWERVVANLPNQMISRPIYASEDHIKDILKLKENKTNEAYVGVYINKEDILSLHPDKVLKDKLGNSLLSIKDRTLFLGNISRFVHITGTYQWDKGHLIKMPPQL